jgi:hypothetical protein
MFPTILFQINIACYMLAGLLTWERFDYSIFAPLQSGFDMSTVYDSIWYWIYCKHSTALVQELCLFT